VFRNLKDKALIKQYLIFFNIALGIILSVLLTSWFAYVRPSQINLAIAQNQYGYYDIKNLPNKTGEVEVDYFGKSKIVDLENSNDLASDSEYVKPSSLVNKQEELDKTNKILVSSEEKKQELLGEGGEQLSLTSEHSTSKPKIALIITNLGLNRKSTELALTLPSECALGFLPYTKTLKPLLNKAQNKGHEIYLYLPLQTTKSSDNHGKHALTTSLAPEEMALRLHLILNSHIKYDGVYSNYNIKASTSIFDQVADKNLFFIMGKGRTDKVERHFKMHKNIIPSNLVLDEEVDKKSIKIKLEALASLAEKNGVALGYSQGFVLSIEMIRDWLPSLQKRGILIVPVSSLAMERK
jgi:polysaccharide deacetylase 2 family uncharacterized protein YibQ